jgi:hypothetical protein
MAQVRSDNLQPLLRIRMATTVMSTFWSRFGVDEEDEEHCLRAVQDRYARCRVQKFEEQGYCSFTLLVTPLEDPQTPSDGSGELEYNVQTDTMIVQIRPAQHALDMSIAQAAEDSFPTLAPVVRSLNLDLPRQLHAYAMSRIPGIPLSRLLPSDQTISSALGKKQERLLESFAAILAHSWRSSSKPVSMDRSTRADSPMEDSSSVLSQCKGKVGSSIVSRLRKLSEGLPDARLRESAKNTLTKVQALEDYPIVLNHGDLIPSNFLVGRDTWEITGLVDWAEAEYLPFGTCLYALENLLGYTTTISESPTFVYYNNQHHLRKLFWNRLFEAVPDLKMRRDNVKTVRDVGVLLWYGIAWDDGAIDRVVNEHDDAVELACLRTFLNVA